MWNRADSREAATHVDPQITGPAASDRRPDEAAAIRVATIGSSAVVKGELSGFEDLTVDGRVEGRIDLPGHALMVGPTGRIQAQIVAKVVIVCGAVVGGISAGDTIDLRQGGSLEGNLTCTRLAIQDGALFCGHVDMRARRPEQTGTEIEDATPAPAAVG